MGDPDAVVDGRGRVRGVSGLRVVDASLIPDAPCTTPNVLVLMLAGRMAGFMDA